MNEREPKFYMISFVVSCKKMSCELDDTGCSDCIEGFVGENIHKHSSFSCSQVTTAHQSKQFVVSLVAHCEKPDCVSVLGEEVVCCTASQEKCELCLRSIVNRGIRQMDGFHAKEITVA